MKSPLKKNPLSNETEMTANNYLPRYFKREDVWIKKKKGGEGGVYTK